MHNAYFCQKVPLLLMHNVYFCQKHAWFAGLRHALFAQERVDGGLRRVLYAQKRVDGDLRRSLFTQVHDLAGIRRVLWPETRVLAGVRRPVFPQTRVPARQNPAAEGMAALRGCSPAPSSTVSAGGRRSTSAAVRLSADRIHPFPRRRRFRRVPGALHLCAPHRRAGAQPCAPTPAGGNRRAHSRAPLQQATSC